jgi:fatty acid desaturase
VNESHRKYVLAESLGRISCVRTNLQLAGSIGAYCCLAVTAMRVASPIIVAATWVGMAFLLFGMMTVMHEAAHGNLYRSRHANRLAGVLAGCALLLCWSIYRSFHLQHHGATRTVLDPERQPQRFTSACDFLRLLIVGPSFLAGLWRYTAGTLRGRRPFFVRAAAVREHIREEVLLLLIGYALLLPVAATHPLLLLRVWLAPLTIMYAYVFPLLTVPEHLYGRGSVSAYENTRTVTSNAALRWAVWNANFHTAHHLAPGVPFHRLPRLDELIIAEARLREESYIRFYWKLLRGFLSARHVAAQKRPAQSRE